MNQPDRIRLYGHPFSSYTWKVQIALGAAEVPYEFCILDEDHPENGAFVAAHGGPLAKFPVLAKGEDVIFESSSIIDYINNRFSPPIPLIPSDTEAAVGIRMLDRVFDNYVMTPMQDVVGEYLRSPDSPDAARCAEARQRLRRSYAWLEAWLPWYHRAPDLITLVECAAAPSLFYADWVEPIGDEFPALKAWRAQLLALPPVSACVEAARPYRAGFPLGAPDRD